MAAIALPALRTLCGVAQLHLHLSTARLYRGVPPPARVRETGAALPRRVGPAHLLRHHGRRLAGADRGHPARLLVGGGAAQPVDIYVRSVLPVRAVAADSAELH